jgi:hypothetical protein
MNLYPSLQFERRFTRVLRNPSHRAQLVKDEILHFSLSQSPNLLMLSRFPAIHPRFTKTMTLQRMFHVKHRLQL